MGNAVVHSPQFFYGGRVSTAAVGVPPTRLQQSPMGTDRWLDSAAPSVRREAEQSDRDGPSSAVLRRADRAPLFRLHRSSLVVGRPVAAGVRPAV